jgi:transcriptional regulator with XRE-family HTH domain
MADGSTLVRRRVAMNARRLREERGLTQEAASERIDCSVQMLRRIEGARATATIDFVATIAAAYRVDVGELFAPVTAWRAPRAGRPRKHSTGSRRR